MDGLRSPLPPLQELIHLVFFRVPFSSPFLCGVGFGRGVRLKCGISLSLLFVLLCTHAGPTRARHLWLVFPACISSMPVNIQRHLLSIEGGVGAYPPIWKEFSNLGDPWRRREHFGSPCPPTPSVSPLYSFRAPASWGVAGNLLVAPAPRLPPYPPLCSCVANMSQQGGCSFEFPYMD